MSRIFNKKMKRDAQAGRDMTQIAARVSQQVRQSAIFSVGEIDTLDVDSKLMDVSSLDYPPYKNVSNNLNMGEGGQVLLLTLNGDPDNLPVSLIPSPYIEGNLKDV